MATGGAKYARLAKNSTTNYDTGWYGPDFFNVKDYGAVGNGSTNDTTACQAAFTAAASANGTVYFPDGHYLITSALTCTVNTVMAVRGNSRFTSVIVQGTTSADGIVADLSSGNNLKNQIQISDLGFNVNGATVAGTAITVTYGNTNIASNANNTGSVVKNIWIWDSVSNNPSGSGGWTNGIKMVNCWNALVNDIQGYGNAPSYSLGSGAGSGALIKFLSGTNYTITNILGYFWCNFIDLGPVSTSTAGQTQIAQGVTIDCVNIVECIEGIHFRTNAANTGPDFLAIDNFQCDQGNISQSTHRGIYIEGLGGVIYLSNTLILQQAGTACIELKDCGGCVGTNVILQSVVTTPTYGLRLNGTSNGSIFAENCSWGSMPINVGGSAGFNTIRNTASAGTVTNTGTGNIIGDFRSFATVQTLTATASFSFSMNIAACGLSGAPGNAFISQLTSIPAANLCAYDFNHAGNSATTAWFLVWVNTGSLTAGAVRFSITVGP